MNPPGNLDETVGGVGLPAHTSGQKAHRAKIAAARIEPLLDPRDDAAWRELTNAVVALCEAVCPSSSAGPPKADLLKPGERLKQMKAGYTPKNIRQFIARFERDNAGDLTPEQWGEWVDGLPIPEFMAMCCMTPDQVAKALGAQPNADTTERPSRSGRTT